jgi:amidophosphoribosyltransferase
MPTGEELIASSTSVEEIRKYLDVDSLGYLSNEGMLGVMPQPAEHYCNACFTGKYPM